MKKILFFLLSLIILASCGKDEPSANKGKLDPNAMILIRPAAGVRATVSGLTALEIVEQGHEIQFTTRYSDDKYNEETIYTASRGFSEAQRDLTIPALKMWGTDVINQKGNYVRDFTHAYDIYITRLLYIKEGTTDTLIYDPTIKTTQIGQFDTVITDTIAYIPEDVINSVRPLIESAYADANYTEVYRLCNEAFTFLSFE